MSTSLDPPVFSSFLLKVASRCNLACDYCYVYQHGDDSWRDMPKLMSRDTIEHVVQQVTEYFTKTPVPESTFVFHGGEPLLWGAERIASTADLLRKSIGDLSEPNFSVQTNALLLDDDAIQILSDAAVKVSISLDGPAKLHDKHRPDHGGNATHSLTVENLNRLRRSAPSIFSGVLAVIDFSSSPTELLQYFADLEITDLDLLLPDRHHDTQRHANLGAEHEADWVRTCIRSWYTSYPHLKIRWFDAMLETTCGLPSPTDAMGFGDVSLCSIDTDGTYGDHDVFKIVGATHAQTKLNVASDAIEALANLPSIGRHREYLRPSGLSQTCRECHVVSSCGGGAVMHRYSRSSGFANPSAHCASLKAAFEEVVSILREEAVPELVDLPFFDAALSVDSSLIRACEEWANARGWTKSSKEERSFGAMRLLAVDQEIRAEEAPSPPIGHLGGIAVHAVDPVFAEAFGTDIVQYTDLARPDLEMALNVVERALALINNYSPSLLASITSLITDILFAHSTEGPSGIFSFSDDAAPDVIFLDPFVSAKNDLLRTEDVADSIIHEFFHHVLYHADSDRVLLMDYEHPRLPAPWCGWELRPTGGFLHGTFVFSNLAKFWTWLAERSESRHPSATSNATTYTGWAHHGIRSLRSGARLTESGLKLIEGLEDSLNQE